MSEQYDDPDDVERAEVHLKITGSDGAIGWSLSEFEEYINDTPGLSCGRERFERIADVLEVTYTPESPRAGIVGPAIGRLCDLLRQNAHIHARVAVPGWSRAFHGGWERDYLPTGQRR